MKKECYFKFCWKSWQSSWDQDLRKDLEDQIKDKLNMISERGDFISNGIKKYEMVVLYGF